MVIWHVTPLRFAPALRALGVCDYIWPFSLRDVWATLLSPKWAEIFVAQMAGDETSLPLERATPPLCAELMMRKRPIIIENVMRNPLYGFV